MRIGGVEKADVRALQSRSGCGSAKASVLQKFKLRIEASRASDVKAASLEWQLAASATNIMKAERIIYIGSSCDVRGRQAMANEGNSLPCSMAHDTGAQE